MLHSEADDSKSAEPSKPLVLRLGNYLNGSKGPMRIPYQSRVSSLQQRTQLSAMSTSFCRRG